MDQSRRAVLRGSIVAVVAGAAGYVAMAARDDKAPTEASAYGSSSNPPGGTLVAKLSDVPADGGVVLSGPKIVLTRSENGDVHGFSAVCTHQGCLVATVQNGLIRCPCHGSSYDAATGQVVSGPAQRPLAPVSVRVSGDAISTG